MTPTYRRRAVRAAAAARAVAFALTLAATAATLLVTVTAAPAAAAPVAPAGAPAASAAAPAAPALAPAAHAAAPAAPPAPSVTPSASPGAPAAGGPDLTAVAACQSDGTYLVTWTVPNPRPDPARIVVVTSRPSETSVTPPSALAAPLAPTTLTQVGVAGDLTSAALTERTTWVSDNATVTQTGTVTLDGRCRPQRPTVRADAPTFTDGSCVAGRSVPPTVAIPVQADVQFALDGLETAAGPHPVTAGRHEVVVSSSTRDLIGRTRFDADLVGAGDCRTVVAPAAPGVVQASCDGAVVVPPDLVIPSPSPSSGVGYSAEPRGPYAPGQTVEVTAVASDGSRLADHLPAGWRAVDSTRATYRIKLAGVDCTVVVQPVAPEVTESACSGTASTPPSLALSVTAGITYETAPAAPFIAGGTVMIRAVAQPGYRMGTPTPPGWDFVDAGLETYAVTFAAEPRCAVARPPAFVDDTCQAGRATGSWVVVPDQAACGTSWAAGRSAQVDTASRTGPR